MFEKEKIMKKFLKNAMKKLYNFVDKYVMTGMGGLVLLIGILVSGVVMCICRTTVPYISSLLVILVFLLYSAVLFEEKGGNEK